MSLELWFLHATSVNLADELKMCVLSRALITVYGLTRFISYGDTLRTREKCHSEQTATPSRGISLIDQRFGYCQNCHSNRCHCKQSGLYLISGGLYFVNIFPSPPASLHCEFVTARSIRERTRFSHPFILRHFMLVLPSSHTHAHRPSLVALPHHPYPSFRFARTVTFYLTPITILHSPF